MLLSNDGTLAMARTCPVRRVHRDGRADLALRPGLRAHGRGEARVELPLQAEVDRQPQVGAGDRLQPLADRHRHARRVDVHALAAVDPAQHRVVLLLEPGAADDLARRQVRPALLVLGRRHPREARAPGRAARPWGYERRGSGTTNTPAIPAAVTASPVPRGTSATGSASVVRSAAASWRRRSVDAAGRPARRAGPRRRAGRAAGRARRAPGPRRSRRPPRSRRAARRAGR